MEWVSVDERLPEAGVKVLFCAELAGVYHVCLGHKASDDRDNRLWFDHAATGREGYPMDVYTVTHWMPLPPLPGTLPSDP